MAHRRQTSLDMSIPNALNLAVEARFNVAIGEVWIGDDPAGSERTGDAHSISRHKVAFSFCRARWSRTLAAVTLMSRALATSA